MRLSTGLAVWSAPEIVELGRCGVSGGKQGGERCELKSLPLSPNQPRFNPEF